MKISKFAWFFALVMVAIGSIQGWPAETQKKPVTTLQQQKTMTPLEKQTLQSSSPTIKLECQKAGPGQPPGSPSSGPCAEQGLKVGAQKNIGGSGGSPDVSKSIPGYGASSKVGGSGQSTGLVDPRAKKEDSKDKPTGKFEDLSSKGKLEKLMDPRAVPDGRAPLEQKPTGAMGELTKGGEGGASQVGTTTIKPGDGKNKSSKQEQQSEEERDANTGMTKKEAQEEAARQLTGGAPMTQKEAQAEKVRQDTGAFKDMAEFNEYAERVRREQAELDRQGRGSAGSSSGGARSGTPGGLADRPCVGPLCPQVRGTPNPMAETGSGGRGGERNPVTGELYTPAELEAARKRQVSLPNDEKGGQPSRMDLEKVYMSPEEMQKRTLDRMTGGKIDPVEGEGTTPSGGKATKQPWQGKGPQPGDPIEEILGGTGTTTGPSTPSKTGQ